MSVTYKLKLDYHGLKDTDNKDLTDEVSLQNGETVTVVFNSYKLELSLYGVTFHRKIYEPGHIQAELLIYTEGDDAPAISTLSAFLVHRKVSLYADSAGVALNYYIQEISPQYEITEEEKNTGDYDDDGNPITETVYEHSIYTKLDIYSPDNLFTLNKFSRAHLGMRLSSDIVKDALSDFQLKYEYVLNGSDTVLSTKMSQDTSYKLTNLAYTYNDERVELIHPYLVQYNESFHDFLKRTANRCGEVFFYEGGKLCIGLKDIPKDKTTNAPDVDVISGARVVFSRISDTPLSVLSHARDSVKELNGTSYKPKDGKIMTDRIEKDDDDTSHYPKDAYPKVDSSSSDYTYRYNSEIASEDHYTLLFKDKFARDAGHQIWFGEYDTALMSELSEILNSKSLMDVITRFTTKTLEAGIAAGAKRDEATDKGNQKVVESAIDNSNDYAVLFAFVDSDRSHWITLDYYSDIRKYGEEQMRKMVCIDMKEGFANKKLGDYIKIPHDDDIYVVVQIDMSSSNVWQRNYDGFFGEGIHLKGQENPQTQYLYAIPLKGEKFYPPVLPDNPFRQSGPQPAFVIDCKDPMGQGRVRIRYPWQPKVDVKDSDISQETTDLSTAKSAKSTSKTTLEKYAKNIKEDKDKGTVTADRTSGTKKEYEDALKDYTNKCIAVWSAENRIEVKKKILEAGTPWIRMTTPMATPGGGMYFRPEEGDEVMVDFENGNVERPFVVSGLYSKNSPAPSQGSRVIVSRNGHTIKMSDPDDSASLAGGIYPGFKYLASCGVDVSSITGDERRLLGGIELTDRYGIYNIKMSSHNRNISISSPFGDIHVGAFTGIKITAPNGNIKIVGKNIDISASNRVKITSGENIKDGNYLKGLADPAAWGKTVGQTLSKGLGADKWFDFSLLRSLLEIILRPVDGTLELKSYRYLLLQAGQGTAHIPYSSYTTKKALDASDLTGLKGRETDLFVQIFVRLGEIVESYTNKYITLFNEFQQEYVAAQGNLTDLLDWQAGGAAAPANPIITTPATASDLVRYLFSETPSKMGLNHKISYGPGKAVHETVVVNQLLSLSTKAAALRKHVEKYGDMFSDLDKATNSWWERRKSSLPKGPSRFAGQAKNALEPNDTDTTNAAIRTTNLRKSVIHIEQYIKDGGAYTLPSVIFSGVLPANTFDAWKKKTKRWAAFRILEACRAGASFFNTFTVGTIAPAAAAPGGYNAGAPYEQDADWTYYLSQITLTEKDEIGGLESFISGAAEGAVKKAIDNQATIEKNIWSFERDIWSESAVGEILFSNTEEHTERLKVADGQLERIDNAEYGDTAAALANLKRIANY